MFSAILGFSGFIVYLDCSKKRVLHLQEKKLNNIFCTHFYKKMSQNITTINIPKQDILKAVLSKCKTFKSL